MTLSQGPLVSVVIPAYNAAETIDETLDSVRAQTYFNLEIIVVDDGSVDETASRVERHCAEDPRVRLLRQPNQGVAVARNTGIADTTGDYIAPVDADDLWHPVKIQRQMDAMAVGGDDMGLVYTWYAQIDERSQITSLSERPIDEGDVLQRMCRGNLIGNGSSPLMRRQAVLEAGGYDWTLRDREAQGCEDLKLYLQIAEKYKFAVIPEYLTGYRQFADSMSGNPRRMMRSYDLAMDAVREKYPHYARDFQIGKSWTLHWYCKAMIRNSRWIDAVWLVRSMFGNDPYYALGLCIRAPIKSLPRFGVALVRRIRGYLSPERQPPPDTRFPSGITIPSRY